jgi:hypothetical protein
MTEHVDSANISINPRTIRKSRIRDVCSNVGTRTDKMTGKRGILGVSFDEMRRCLIAAIYDFCIILHVDAEKCVSVHVITLQSHLLCI